jgi:hypothetical protein
VPEQRDAVAAAAAAAVRHHSYVVRAPGPCVHCGQARRLESRAGMFSHLSCLRFLPSIHSPPYNTTVIQYCTPFARRLDL